MELWPEMHVNEQCPDTDDVETHGDNRYHLIHTLG